VSPRAYALVVALGMLLPQRAHAQTETRAAVAEALYRQARDLLAAGNYVMACPKFAESQRLDPATGTLLNLAACHEKQGRLASAWLEYSDAAVAARRDQREDRVEYAQGRAASLESKLSRLTLLLAADADQPELSIELDGASVGRAVVGAPTPVDPGSHTVRASAPGKKPWSQSVQIGAESDQQSLTIPKLEVAPPEPATEAAPPPAGAASMPPAGASEQPTRDELGSRPIPTSAYVSGGATLALAVGASVTGLAFLNRKSDFDDLKKTEPDSNTTQQRRDSARSMGYINVGLWAATALGAGVTTYFFVTRPTRASATRLLPWAGPESAGLSVAGGF
jgi:hypothetical protein